MRTNKKSATTKGKHSLKNHLNNIITKQTRQEGYENRPVKRSKQILDVLGGREMTAREIAEELGYTDLNAVKPRLTELKELGRVEVVGKRKDHVTNINVAVWRIADVD